MLNATVTLFANRGHPISFRECLIIMVWCCIVAYVVLSLNVFSSYF